MSRCFFSSLFFVRKHLALAFHSTLHCIGACNTFHCMVRSCTKSMGLDGGHTPFHTVKCMVTPILQWRRNRPAHAKGEP